MLSSVYGGHQRFDGGGWVTELAPEESRLNNSRSYLEFPHVCAWYVCLYYFGVKNICNHSCNIYNPRNDMCTVWCRTYNGKYSCITVQVWSPLMRGVVSGTREEVALHTMGDSGGIYLDQACPPLRSIVIILILIFWITNIRNKNTKIRNKKYTELISTAKGWITNLYFCSIVLSKKLKSNTQMKNAQT